MSKVAQDGYASYDQILKYNDGTDKEETYWPLYICLSGNNRQAALAIGGSQGSSQGQFVIDRAENPCMDR